MLSLVLLTACGPDDPERIPDAANGKLAHKANVRSITACAGLRCRRNHDNAADSKAYGRPES
jgi:hypothetical protein